MKISVVLAAYKGEKYIGEQLSSVLSQLGENDEIIVSDDCPSAETEGIISSFSDSRIKYIHGPSEGVVKNFENAMKNASGDVIFLCDQDDVWLPGKVTEVMALIEKGYSLVLHDAKVTDASLKVISDSYFGTHRPTVSYFGNLMRNSFVGCCMAFTKELAVQVTPFPEKIPMHDWWIALAAMKKGFRVTLCDKPLILWRRHGDNVTGNPTTLKQKICWRLDLISCLGSLKK